MNDIAEILEREAAPAPANARKVYVKTYGCQMNVYDSQRMTDALGADGYVETATIDDADMVLINTCISAKRRPKRSIRSSAACASCAKSGAPRAGTCLSALPVASPRRRARRSCAARRWSISSSGRRPIIACRRLPPKPRRGVKLVETDYAIEDKFEQLPAHDARQIRARGVTAFLTVQEGCDKFCTFCVVPYTRGAEVSRPVGQIVAEARQLVDAGVREVTLLGQNVNAWHGEGPDGREWGLGQLLHELAKIEGLARLRYTTSHPRDMDDALIEAHRDLECLMPYLHLPVQAGSTAC